MTSTSLEYIAANAEEAINKGLNALGVSREEVDIEILDNGSKGIFGIGARQARVRMTVKADSLRAVMEKEAEAEAQNAAAAAEAEKQPAKQEAPAAPAPAKEERRKSEPKQEKRREEQKSAKPAKQPVAEPEDEENPAPVSGDVVNEETMKIAQNVVRDLMEKMRVKATINAKIGEAEDDMDSRVIMIDIQGDDLSYLIGRHSEVLHSLQYITSLIVGREVGHWVPLVLDVQGYRERRERQLCQMATRMADQVIKTGRRISLEPMPATERRIIHLALRGNSQITTESIGEEPNRKVVIYPKENK